MHFFIIRGHAQKIPIRTGNRESISDGAGPIASIMFMCRIDGTDEYDGTQIYT